MSKSDVTAMLTGDDPALFGRNREPGLVAVEHLPGDGEAGDGMALFFRRDGRLERETEPFEPFVIGEEDLLADCPEPCLTSRLEGPEPLNTLAVFPSWAVWRRARRWLREASGMSPSATGAPYYCVADPVQQHLMTTGRTSFLGLAFEELRRMQIDIECVTTGGFEFCNPEREGDRIVALAMSDQTGWTEVLCLGELDERGLLEKFVQVVRQRDPDVIEGHNLFNFDLPYIRERARRHRVKLALGRDGSVPRWRPSRFNAAERTLAYQRCDIFGRQVVDTLFQVQAYDVTHRSLDGFGLKEVAVHFGIAAPERTYVDGGRIGEIFERDPDELLRYVRDDVVETRELSGLLSRSSFAQARMLPYSYQNVCVRGAATRIDALLVREYLRQGHALPRTEPARPFGGGYTDMFVEGLVENVHHCDVRSLYPSLMLARGLGPRRDRLGVFLALLDTLRRFRLEAKRRMQSAGSAAEKAGLDALQSTFKVLINSFYGYLGFGQARFADFAAAERVTRDGRELLQDMIAWLRAHGAEPVEIDTDGIYFVPPPGGGDEQRAFRAEFADSLPEGIEIEFDGEYRSMYSYKMKNYALLDRQGEMVIKGAALKSRGLEPFQRDFLRALLRGRLNGAGEQDLVELREEYEQAIRDRAWPVERLAKTETLQDSPEAYAARVKQGKRGRAAAYELALASEREYRAGDRVSYYVTGRKKSVAVHEAARLVSDWDPERRDENVPYYLAKLRALCKKFDVGGA